MNQSCASSRCDEQREAEGLSAEKRQRYCEDDSDTDTESREDEEHNDSGREKADVALVDEVKSECLCPLSYLDNIRDLQTLAYMC